MNARTLYERFRGSVARRFITTGVRFGSKWLTKRGQLNISIPTDMAIIGPVNALEYDCVRDGKLKKARHAFAPGTKPLFVVGARRGELFIIGTANKFTDRGIVDYSRDGRAVVYSEKTGLTRFLRD